MTQHLVFITFEFCVIILIYDMLPLTAVWMIMSTGLDILDDNFFNLLFTENDENIIIHLSDILSRPVGDIQGISNSFVEVIIPHMLIRFHWMHSLNKHMYSMTYVPILGP